MKKRKQRKKRKHVLEYLMTYGWIILVIAIVAGALYYMNVFGGGFDTPTGFSDVEILADAWTITTNGILEFTATNSAEETVYITSFNISDGTVDYADEYGFVLEPDGKITYTIFVFSEAEPGDLAILDLSFIYTLGDSTEQTMSSDILTGLYQ